MAQGKLSNRYDSKLVLFSDLLSSHIHANPNPNPNSTNKFADLRPRLFINALEDKIDEFIKNDSSYLTTATPSVFNFLLFTPNTDILMPVFKNSSFEQLKQLSIAPLDIIHPEWLYFLAQIAIEFGGTYGTEHTNFMTEFKKLKPSNNVDCILLLFFSNLIHSWKTDINNPWTPLTPDEPIYDSNNRLDNLYDVKFKDKLTISAWLHMSQHDDVTRPVDSIALDNNNNIQRPHLFYSNNPQLNNNFLNIGLPNLTFPVLSFSFHGYNKTDNNYAGRSYYSNDLTVNVFALNAASIPEMVLTRPQVNANANTGYKYGKNIKVNNVNHADDSGFAFFGLDICEMRRYGRVIATNNTNVTVNSVTFPLFTSWLQNKGIFDIDSFINSLKDHFIYNRLSAYLPTVNNAAAGVAPFYDVRPDNWDFGPMMGRNLNTPVNNYQALDTILITKLALTSIPKPVYADFTKILQDAHDKLWFYARMNGAAEEGTTFATAIPGAAARRVQKNGAGFIHIDYRNLLQSPFRIMKQLYIYYKTQNNQLQCDQIIDRHKLSNMRNELLMRQTLTNSPIDATQGALGDIANVYGTATNDNLINAVLLPLTQFIYSFLECGVRKQFIVNDDDIATAQFIDGGVNIGPAGALGGAPRQVAQANRDYAAAQVAVAGGLRGVRALNPGAAIGLAPVAALATYFNRLAGVNVATRITMANYTAAYDALITIAYPLADGAGIRQLGEPGLAVLATQGGAYRTGGLGLNIVHISNEIFLDNVLTVLNCHVANIAGVNVRPFTVEEKGYLKNFIKALGNTFLPLNNPAIDYNVNYLIAESEVGIATSDVINNWELIKTARREQYDLYQSRPINESEFEIMSRIMEIYLKYYNNLRREVIRFVTNNKFSFNFKKFVENSFKNFGYKKIATSTGTASRNLNPDNADPQYNTMFGITNNGNGATQKDKKNYLLDNNGKLWEIDANNKQIELPIPTFDDKCMTTGFGKETDPLLKAQECADYYTQCLRGSDEAIIKCRNFAEQEDYWKIAEYEVNNILPGILLQTLESFGFKIVDSDQHTNLKIMSSIDDWYKHLKESSNIGLTDDEINKIKKNTKLIKYLSGLVARVNANPSMINVKYDLTPNKPKISSNSEQRLRPVFPIIVGGAIGSGNNIYTHYKELKLLIENLHDDYNTFNEQKGGGDFDKLNHTINSLTRRLVGVEINSLFEKITKYLESNKIILASADYKQIKDNIENFIKYEKSLQATLKLFQLFHKWITIHGDSYTDKTMTTDKMEEKVKELGKKASMKIVKATGKARKLDKLLYTLHQSGPMPFPMPLI